MILLFALVLVGSIILIMISPYAILIIGALLLTMVIHMIMKQNLLKKDIEEIKALLMEEKEAKRSLEFQTNSKVAELPEALAKTIEWGPVRADFTRDYDLDSQRISNVSMVPFIGEQCVMFQLEDGRWELPGGTLEPGEQFMQGLRREAAEELGAELKSYYVFGQFNCRSLAEKAYRPHIPHPEFVRLVGYGDVELFGEPLNPPDGEQVAAVVLMDIEEAVSRFEEQDRHDLAGIYMLAYRIRAAKS
ncbi:NUDIX hydrolase [Paenibacillus pinihumi]|uniref:NUDIX hydrolase n=1 Tax=Paenibacillus pinihumi TaxID=669462 RepID=UPI001FE1F007|nr:NUDIX domain-containing protein [Paenibacillus pinihumi]